MGTWADSASRTDGASTSCAANRFGHFGEFIRSPACQRDFGTAPG
jgi:hypothetical protein